MQTHPRTAQLAQRQAKLAQLMHVKALLQHNPKPSLNGLDDKLARYLDFDGGFFVELGANDGYTQSNTFYLEYCRNWRGVLIEGIPELYQRCAFTRMNSCVVHGACVDKDFDASHVNMRYANLMSIVEGAMGDSAKDDEHVRIGVAHQELAGSYCVNVPARTLTSILEEQGVTHIDFLSLDVEGCEASVLRGLDFSRFKPRYICVEARFLDQVDVVLQPHYQAVEQLSKHDYLYRAMDNDLKQ